MSLSEWMVKQVAYPLHEKARGRDTLRQVDELGEMMEQSVGQVRRESMRRLGRQLQFASMFLPFYSARFEQYGVEPDAADPAAELLRLPVLTKAEIRAARDGIVYRDSPGGLVPAVTGGTTGETLKFYTDRIRAASNMAARLWLQQQFGVQPGDRRVYLWGSPLEVRVSRVKRLRDRLLNEVVLNAFELTPERMDEYIRRIQRYQPRLMYGFSSALALLARHAAQEHGPDDFAFLKAIVATAEPVTGDQRKQMRAAFGCPVLAEYGSREGGLMAHECAEGRMHIMTPHTHVEILAQGEPVAPGEVGEVVVTPLNTWAQPFIRYAQGDLAAFEEGQCECGWPLPTLRLASGRVNGFIALPDGRLCSGVMASYILRDHPGVVRYHMHQRTINLLQVRLVVDDDFEKSTVDVIRARCREVLGPAMVVECSIVDDIPLNPSGKRCDFVSDVAADMTSFEIVPAQTLMRERTGAAT